MGNNQSHDSVRLSMLDVASKIPRRLPVRQHRLCIVKPIRMRPCFLACAVDSTAQKKCKLQTSSHVSSAPKGFLVLASRQLCFICVPLTG